MAVAERDLQRGQAPGNERTGEIGGGTCVVDDEDRDHRGERDARGRRDVSTRDKRAGSRRARQARPAQAPT